MGVAGTLNLRSECSVKPKWQVREMPNPCLTQAMARKKAARNEPGGHIAEFKAQLSARGR